MKQFLFDLLTRFRGVILLSLLPIGYIFDAVLQLRNFIYERFIAAPEQHDRRVAEIQQQVRR